MSDRDVILQISIAAILCVFIISHSHFSLAQEKIPGESDTCYSNSNATYDSYENYLPAAKHTTVIKTSIKQKISSNKRTVPSRNKKAAKPKKSNAFIRYTVRKGDTLTGIAKKNNLTVAVLQAANKLHNQNCLKKGMMLKIPAKATTAVSSAKTETNAGHIAARINSPDFQWPIKNVLDCRNDGLNGVKSIGIIITAKPGSAVLSSAPGKVRKIGRMRGFGNYIVITHAGRYSTVYSNLEMIMVSPGEIVPTGNTIGRIGSTEQKIHFQIDREGKPEDPLRYLPKKS